MRKRLITLGIAFLMLFSLAACNIDFDLADYKTTAKVEIESYATKSNYSDENWNIVCGIVEVGKAAVDAAKSKTDVDAAVNDTKIAIDAVEMEVVMELSEELKGKIKSDYSQEFGRELCFGDDLLNKFYGLYNGAAIFFIASADAAIKIISISDVEFSSNYGWTIWVWKDGFFYNLEDIESIFEAGILTQSNLEQIGTIHAESYARG